MKGEKWPISKRLRRRTFTMKLLCVIGLLAAMHPAHASIPEPSHEFDFRGCTTDVPVVDTYDSAVAATPYNGPWCSSEGLNFDGSDDYVRTTSWSFGGEPITVEVYVKYENTNYWSRILDFGDGENDDNVIIANTGTTTDCAWNLRQTPGDGTKELVHSNCFIINEWTHIVATTEGNTMKLYRNGLLMATERNGITVPLRSRTYHYVGRSNWGPDGYFDGTIAYLRFWHGTALDSEDIQWLYEARAFGFGQLPTFQPTNSQRPSQVPQPAPTPNPTVTSMPTLTTLPTLTPTISGTLTYPCGDKTRRPRYLAMEFKSGTTEWGGYDNAVWTTFEADEVLLDGSKKLRAFTYPTRQVTLEVTWLNANDRTMDACQTVSIPLDEPRSLLDIFSSGEEIKTQAPVFAWRRLFYGVGFQENCNHQGFNIILRGGEWLPAQHGAGAMRLGMYTNEQDDCSTCDSYRGIGYDKPAGASCSFGGCGSCDGVRLLVSPGTDRMALEETGSGNEALYAMCVVFSVLSGLAFVASIVIHNHNKGDNGNENVANFSCFFGVGPCTMSLIGFALLSQIFGPIDGDGSIICEAGIYNFFISGVVFCSFSGFLALVICSFYACKHLRQNAPLADAQPDPMPQQDGGNHGAAEHIEIVQAEVVGTIDEDKIPSNLVGLISSIEGGPTTQVSLHNRSLVDILGELQQAKNEGLLSESEFNAAKTRAIGHFVEAI